LLQLAEHLRKPGFANQTLHQTPYAMRFSNRRPCTALVSLSFA